MASLKKLGQQCLGLLQNGRIEAFSEPAVDRLEEIAGCIALALFAPEPGETDRSAQLPELRTLLLRDADGLGEAALGSGESSPLRSNSPRTRCNSASANLSPVSAISRSASTRWPSPRSRCFALLSASASNVRAKGKKTTAPVARYSATPARSNAIPSAVWPLSVSPHPR